MATIPSIINGVQVEFGPQVNNDVSMSLIAALKHCIKPNIAPPYPLFKIYISSEADQHVMPSRHAQHKAVDISRINNIKIAIGYPGEAATVGIVNAIQNAFETCPGRRENFGPHLKRKLGASFNIAGHHDHIHLSVN